MARRVINYVTEINRFYDWLETNDVPKSVIAFWQAIMQLNYRTDWKETFEVAISTLMNKTKFKRSDLFEARNILTQKGRIEWKSRGGNLCATYKIIFFSVHNTDAKGDTNPDAVPDTSLDAKATQTRTNNSNSKYSILSTKEKEDNNSEALPEKKPPRKAASPKKETAVFIPPTLEDFKKYFREHGYREDKAETAYRHYSNNDWKDSRDKPVKNWKSKLNNVWFTPENKAQVEIPLTQPHVRKPSDFSNYPEYVLYCKTHSMNPLTEAAWHTT